MTPRWGITIPFQTVPLSEHASWLAQLADLGYTDAWTAEAGPTDGFTPLALAAAWEPRLRLGTAIVPVYLRGAGLLAQTAAAIVPVYLRGPGLLAQTAAAMAEAAPPRFALGVGASSPVIVKQWNGLRFDRPYARARDTIRFLRATDATRRRLGSGWLGPPARGPVRPAGATCPRGRAGATSRTTLRQGCPGKSRPPRGAYGRTGRSGRLRPPAPP